MKPIRNHRDQRSQISKSMMVIVIMMIIIVTMMMMKIEISS
jgi:hypothetical protein